MRAVIQRVTEASVKVEENIVGKIDKGLLVLLGVGEEDNDKDLEYMVDKVLGLRIFEDDNGKMNLSLLDIGGEILIISQFTLYGDVRKGKRPSFTKSAHPDIAKDIYLKFVEKCKEKGIKTEEGIFGANMDVSLINDGPVTIIIDSKKTF
ncbi:D-aminoacyl-tRNA deacylase [Schnuerera sp.]|uniref:D-aminoacyl-tRNA deacylase n=1 Tax=Schnuerera sp. TaxID=2794844 RepID=UPI002CE11788|nr:D-aminoacyl-tRNA deacylase [Schnuerera sp.]HSH35807.1 D-aminoacyl-tRNA deacylase [Schnuerera sp.]